MVPRKEAHFSLLLLAFTDAPNGIIADGQRLTDLSIGLTLGPHVNELLTGAKCDCNCHSVFPLSSHQYRQIGLTLLRGGVGYVYCAQQFAYLAMASQHFQLSSLVASFF